MLHIFGIISGVFAIVSAVPYIRDTLKGSTRPNQVTWFIWVLLLVIALLSQISSGGKDSLVFVCGDLIATSIILVLALFKGERQWHWIDKWALVGAGIGLVLWGVFNQPVLALAMIIFVDFCGAVPTLRKSFAEPESETFIAYLITATGAVFGILAVGALNISLLVYPLYIMLVNLSVALAIWLGRRHLKTKNI